MAGVELLHIGCIWSRKPDESLPVIKQLGGFLSKLVRSLQSGWKEPGIENDSRRQAVDNVDEDLVTKFSRKAEEWRSCSIAGASLKSL